MRDPNQVFIFNDEELSLIKNTFSDNDTLLYAVRKVLLQFPLTEQDKVLLRALTPEVIAILKKRILPEISDDFPLGQLPSILTTLTEQLKVKDVQEMAPLFTAKKLQIGYLEQQFAVLANIDAGTDRSIREENPVRIHLSDLANISDDAQQTFINMQAYLFLLGYIDPMLGFIKSLAGQKAETLEEQKKRLMRDSSR